MTTAITKTTSSTKKSKQKNKPAPAQPDSAVVLRCAVCGSMDLDDAFDHHPVTMDGAIHELRMCRNNGACIYQVQLLAERLEFREIDGAPMLKELEGTHVALTTDESAVLNEAIELARRVCQQSAPESIPSDGECLHWIALTYLTTMKADHTQN